MQTKETLRSSKVNERANFNSSVISIPSLSNIKNTYVKALNSELELTACCSNENPIQNILSEQHPIINTWLLLSSISICFLSAVLYIIQ